MRALLLRGMECKEAIDSVVHRGRRRAQCGRSSPPSLSVLFPPLLPQYCCPFVISIKEAMSDALTPKNGQTNRSLFLLCSERGARMRGRSRLTKHWKGRRDIKMVSTAEHLSNSDLNLILVPADSLSSTLPLIYLYRIHIVYGVLILIYGACIKFAFLAM